MLTRRRAVLGAGAASATALAAPAIAQSTAWPGERPVEVIVIANAGGSLDAMARLVMPYVAERVPGMRAIVSNRPGAGGQVGLEAVFNAAPDGYTLGATTFPAHNAMPMERQTRYRPLDFAFLANVVEDANAYFVRADSPFRTLGDLIEAAKARPGQISCASTGIGSDDHIFMLAFEAAARIPPTVHTPFNGIAAIIPQLLGGHLDVVAANVGDAIALVREGKMRALAQAAASRGRYAPEVPTMRELGFDIVTAASRGIVGPSGMPPAAVAKLEDAFRGALADPRFIAEAERVSMPLRPLVGAEYKKMVQENAAMLRALWQARPWRER
jgi:tripartite-type tricarboxylate transporter receptor subunit TctC